MSKQEKTTLGTPRSESWDTDWFRRVDLLEQDLDHRICGAHAPDYEPCQIKSTHKNGRCRFHGGHPRIGGQRGNRNAVTHGLYSRKIRQCGDGCPIWDQCPYAAEDVMELAARKRPLCFYERRDYDRIMGAFEREAEGGEGDRSREKESTGSDSSSSRIGGASPTLQESDSPSRPNNSPNCHSREGGNLKKGRSDDAQEPNDSNPYAMILNDTTALLYTMFNRAAAALSAHDLTEETTASGENYSMKSTKVSAIATAFMRIGRELQAHLRLRHLLVPKPEKDDKPFSLPGFMQPIIEQAGDVYDDIVNQLREESEPGYEGPRLFDDDPGPEPAPG